MGARIFITSLYGFLGLGRASALLNPLLLLIFNPNHQDQILYQQFLFIFEVQLHSHLEKVGIHRIGYKV